MPIFRRLVSLALTAVSPFADPAVTRDGANVGPYGARTKTQTADQLSPIRRSEFVEAFVSNARSMAR
jgi:hypothetical protein